MTDEKSDSASSEKRPDLSSRNVVVSEAEKTQNSPVLVGALLILILCVVAVLVGRLTGRDLSTKPATPAKPRAASLSSQAVTTTMTFGCYERSYAVDMLRFRNEDDSRSFQRYIDENKCSILRGGLPITVTNDDSAVVGVYMTGFNEITYWVPRQHIRSQ